MTDKDRKTLRELINNTSRNERVYIGFNSGYAYIGPQGGQKTSWLSGPPIG